MNIADFRPTAWLPLLTLLLLAAPLHAQARPGGAGGGMPNLPTAIRGVVVDASSARPLGFATVSIWSVNDASLVTGTLSRTDGSFLVEGVRPGRYLVRITYLGYASFESEPLAVTPASPTADLGTIRVAPEAVTLDGVTVEGERARAVLAADRNTYLTEDMPATAEPPAVAGMSSVR